MGYTVKDLLRSNKFPEMQLINDDSGIDREIKGVRIIEVADMEKFLGGGEILLTSLRAYKDIEEWEFLFHLNELSQKAVSAFVVKDVRDTSQQRRLFEVLMQFTEEHQIPVLELPEDIYYWAVIKHILLRINNLETAKLTYFKITYDNINKVYFDTLDKLTLDQEIKAIMIQTERVLGNPTALYDGELNCLASSNSAGEKLVLTKEIEQYVPNIITRNEYLRQTREHTEYIIKLKVIEESDFYLCITENDGSLTTLDFIALENVIDMLNNLLSRYETGINYEKKYRKDLEYRLLNGSLSDAEEDEAAHILNLEESEEYRVITFCLKSGNVEEKFNVSQRQEIEFAEKEIARYLPKECIYGYTNQIVYIHKEDTRESKLEFRRKVEELQQCVQLALQQKDTDVEFQVGIGKCVCGYHDLSESYEDSQMAIKYIGIFREVVGDKYKSVVDYSKLGFFRIFTNMTDKEQLRPYIPDSLYNLYQYDQQKNGELVSTLECYLNHNQSLKKTSQLMYVHYRTVSYRLEKIAEISGMDFTNVSEMLAVRNGLIILKIMERM